MQSQVKHSHGGVQELQASVDAHWTTEFTATESSDGRWWIAISDDVTVAATEPIEVIRMALEHANITTVNFRNARNEIIDEYHIDTDGDIKRADKCQHCRRPLQRGGRDYTL